MTVRPLVAAIVAGLCAVPAGAQTVEEVIAQHVQARGGLDRIKALQSMRMSGTLSIGNGLDAPMVLELKRPSMMRLDVTVGTATGSQAFSGDGGWVLMAFAGITAPQPMPAEVVRDAKAQADFDGPLVDYKAKGHQVALAGTDTVEGRRAYKLTLTMADGAVRHIYLDAETFLEVKSEATRTIRGMDVASASYLSDYRKVDGLMLPFRMETGIGGAPERQRMVIEKIELNVPIDTSRFKMPGE